MGTEGPRGSRRPPCGGCLRLCIDDQESDAGPLREMRAGVRLCAGVWQVVAAEDCRLDGQRCYSEQPCAVQRDCVGLLPFSSRRGLCAGRPVCQERGAGCTCVRQAVRQGVQGSRGRSVRGRRDSSCSCCRGDQETPPLSWPARHRWPLLEGRRHRGTGQPASLRRSRTQRGTAAIHIAVFPEDAALVRCCVPTRSCSRWRAVHVMPSAVLRRAVFEEPKRKRARSRAGSARGR